jgi:hypothetical protein
MGFVFPGQLGQGLFHDFRTGGSQKENSLQPLLHVPSSLGDEELEFWFFFFPLHSVSLLVSMSRIGRRISGINFYNLGGK